MKFKKGQTPWNKGKKTTEEAKEKQRQAKLKNPTKYWLGKNRIELRNEESLKRTDESKYVMVHRWINKTFGKPNKCESCGIEKLVQWSNKDHKYKKERKDWQKLCPKCHKNYDKKYLGVKA